jgi:hypothetical protein
MPLVERRTQSKTKNHGTIRATRTLYVEPGKLKPGDTIVPPTKRQLAELAVRYPEEFADEARAAGVAAPKAKAETPSHDVDQHSFTEAQEAYLALNAKAAIAFVRGEDDTEVLGECHDAEQRRPDGPRSSVVNAFHAKGIGAE